MTLFSSLATIAVAALAVAPAHAVPVANANPEPAVVYKTVNLPPVYVTRNTYGANVPVHYVTQEGPIAYSTVKNAASAPTPTPGSGTGQLVEEPAELVYSPYNNDMSCKDARTVSNDLYYLKSKGAKSLRIYATDCDSLNTVIPVARQLGMQITQGTWISDAGINSGDYQLQALISWAQSNGWDKIRRVLIGNEGIYNGWYTAQQLADKINQSRDQLRAAGFNGPVSTAEIVASYQNYPVLCRAVDFAGANLYSYFTPDVSPINAGPFIKAQYDLIQKACPDVPVSVTETGYPHCGKTNGLNVPNTQNQIIALNSILEAFDGDVTILTPFDDLWKNPGPYGVEQCFGMISLL